MIASLRVGSPWYVVHDLVTWVVRDLVATFLRSLAGCQACRASRDIAPIASPSSLSVNLAGNQEYRPCSLQFLSHPRLLFQSHSLTHRRWSTRGRSHPRLLSHSHSLARTRAVSHLTLTPAGVGQRGLVAVAQLLRQSWCTRFFSPCPRGPHPPSLHLRFGARVPSMYPVLCCQLCAVLSRLYGLPVYKVCCVLSTLFCVVLSLPCAVCCELVYIACTLALSSEHLSSHFTSPLSK